ncbi:uncharacterized protein CLUP02_12403 [Colletotrichum lupini]|uniref:Uncharacterized protein n=1 Tax=Colletotrichum lupini TaxID=145971 RepID=A0A9Q8WKR9_9PEZI|nr:uncharacterized protein CLUP02_12403 [Colletotrichum lupini]UQC86901.1 hypothetical protein CLUP02_12403 [Colletotrichum lupini]
MGSFFFGGATQSTVDGRKLQHMIYVSPRRIDDLNRTDLDPPLRDLYGTHSSNSIMNDIGWPFISDDPDELERIATPNGRAARINVGSSNRVLRDRGTPGVMHEAAANHLAFTFLKRKI